MPRRPRLAELTRPQLRHALDWSRLFDVPDASGTWPVAWLSGPPGAGKTTLVSTYVAATKPKPLWYTLDGGDADPALSFVHLRKAATALEGSSRRLPLFDSEYLAAPAVFARKYVRTLYIRKTLGASPALTSFSG